MSRDVSGEKNPAYRHGMASRQGMAREYRIWAAMKTRCSNRNQLCWKRYGGRGITVCERWQNSFEAFLADMGPCPSPHHSIDRIKNHLGYEPGNCRWATPKEQAFNSSAAKHVFVNGVEMTLCDAARVMGVDRTLLTKRIASGMTPQQAVDKPVGKHSQGVRAAWARKKQKQEQAA